MIAKFNERKNEPVKSVSKKSSQENLFNIIKENNKPEKNNKARNLLENNPNRTNFNSKQAPLRPPREPPWPNPTDIQNEEILHEKRNLILCGSNMHNVHDFIERKRPPRAPPWIAINKISDKFSC